MPFWQKKANHFQDFFKLFWNWKLPIILVTVLLWRSLAQKYTCHCMYMSMNICEWPGRCPLVRLEKARPTELMWWPTDGPQINLNRALHLWNHKIYNVHQANLTAAKQMTQCMKRMSSVSTSPLLSTPPYLLFCYFLCKVNNQTHTNLSKPDMWDSFFANCMLF